MFVDRKEQPLDSIIQPNIAMEKWLGKYRIPSARATWWDYANEGAYFITICTHDKIHHFGSVAKGKMQLSTMGAIVQGFWYEIPRHFDNVALGEFIVMPNHVHGILILNSPESDESNPVEIGHCPISPNISNKSNAAETPAQKRFRNQGTHTISSIVGAFKSVSSKHIHRTFPNSGFDWQKLFWDNIIQDNQAFDNITHYIINNPNKWEEDRFYQQNPAGD